MTPREFLALKQVWASHQATFHNAHFRAPNDLVFLPDDFIHPLGRKERAAKAAQEKLELAMEKRRLGMMKAGEKDGVPEWALGRSN